MTPGYNLSWRFFSDEPPKPAGFPGAAPEGEQGKALSGRTKIVVVNDERTIAETLVEILDGEGFEAVAATTGDAALALVSTFEPDIVISDVVLPGLNGVEVGIRIREMLPKCRVILFSGQAATMDLLKQARERGHTFEILAKPIKPEDLLLIIRQPRSHIPH